VDGLGWAKQAEVQYGSDAQWLILVTNIGNAPLENVTIADTVSGASPTDVTVDGVLEPGQSALVKVTTSGVTNTSPWGDGVDTASSTEFGEYSFKAGQDVVNTAQATATMVADPDIAVTSNESTAEVRAVAYAVGNYVWLDENANGVQDPDEKGVKGVEVRLLDSSDTVVKTMLTNDDGYYLFDLLEAGSYKIQFVLPDGYMWTQPPAPDADYRSDSNADVQSAYQKKTEPFTVVLAPGRLHVVDSAGVDGIKVTAPSVDPSIDAGVVLIAPAIDLEKFVCEKGTGCADPKEEEFKMPSLTEPTGGWVKATTIPYNTEADWLITLKNTGNVPIADANLILEEFTGGRGFTNESCGVPEAPIPVLEPGAAAFLLCRISHVTNVEAIGSGKDIINTARADGAPVDNEGNSLKMTGGGDWDRVKTKVSSAEVNTTPPPKPDTGGIAQTNGYGATAAAMGLGGILLLGLAVYRRRTT